MKTMIGKDTEPPPGAANREGPSSLISCPITQTHIRQHFLEEKDTQTVEIIQL